MPNFSMAARTQTFPVPSSCRRCGDEWNDEQVRPDTTRTAAIENRSFNKRLQGSCYALIENRSFNKRLQGSCYARNVIHTHTIDTVIRLKYGIFAVRHH